MKTFDLILREHNSKRSFVFLEIIGYLDAHTIEQFENLCEDLLNQGWTNVILDLKGLTYISSAGIGALMRLAHKLRERDGDLILLKPSEKVFNIFNLLGFTKIFKIVESKDEAVDILNPIFKNE